MRRDAIQIKSGRYEQNNEVWSTVQRWEMQVSETENRATSDTELQYINNTTLKQYDVNLSIWNN
jgi:hypothetical protein